MPAHNSFGTLPPELREEPVHLPAGRNGIPPDVIPEFGNLMPERGDL